MKPVLLATDGSSNAEKATETAIELARLLETELVVVTAWNVPSTAVGFAPLDAVANDKAEADAEIGSTGSRARIVIIRAREELVAARAVRTLLCRG